MPVAVPELEKARTTLDAWVRELMQWHFSPEPAARSGCSGPRRPAGIPARDPVYDDLDKFGLFQDEWLRGGPVRRWVPRAYKDQPIYTFETGGSTGVPKSRININDFRIDYELYSKTLPDDKFPKGSDWLMVGPSGPRRLRLAIEHLAQYRGGMCFMVDLDPRWVIKLIKMGEMEMMELYKRHVIDQALTLLKAHDDIKCLFTTPKLLEALCERDLAEESRHHRRVLRRHRNDAAVPSLRGRRVDGGREFRPTYGNTLMGLGPSKPPARKTTGRSSITRPRRAR
jgi:hypothetical protein